VHAAALYVEIHIGESRSLKQKRSVVKHLLETARQRYRVAASEVAHQDLWQLAGLGFAAVSAEAGQVESILDNVNVERFVWSHPEIEVSSSRRHWVDTEG
jgi:uncharacterized protein YlxP (DUF503 family)